MERNVHHKTTAAVMGWFRDQIFERKMSSPLGFVLLAILSVGVAYITVLLNYKAGVGIVGLVAGLLLCIVTVQYPVFGYSLCFVLTFFLLLPSRMSTSPVMIPTGLIPEYYAYLVMLGLLTKEYYRKELTAAFWNSPIVLCTLITLAYLMLEFFNPAMQSKMGWFNFTRKQLSFAAFIMISYMLFNSRENIRFFMRLWIFVATVHALYCCKQQWFGYFQFEYRWLVSDPKRYDLFVNGGFVRRFGLVSDPAAAGILYACSTALVLVLGIRAKETWKRITYLSLAVIHFLASSYSGTRTATLMIVAGMVFYCIMTLYEKRTLLIAGAFGVTLMALLFAPIYDNMIINRLRSTFEGSDDPSAKVRDINRQAVQPYVWSHPIGGGLNTSGLVGSIYNPGHYLSTVPPDSGIVQTMVEQGPIGLALMLIFYYIVLRTGIKHFYRVKDPWIKTLYVANLVSIFTLMVAQFSQMAIGQYPSVLYFYAGLALLLRLHHFDSYKEKEATEH